MTKYVLAKFTGGPADGGTMKAGVNSMGYPARVAQVKFGVYDHYYDRRDYDYESNTWEYVYRGEGNRK